MLIMLCERNMLMMKLTRVDLRTVKILLQLLEKKSLTMMTQLEKRRMKRSLQLLLLMQIAL